MYVSYAHLSKLGVKDPSKDTKLHFHWLAISNDDSRLTKLRGLRELLVKSSRLQDDVANTRYFIFASGEALI